MQGQGGQGLRCSTSDESFPPQCVLTGRWVNDLGSNMTIMAVNEKGEFLGSYHTAVTATGNEIKVSPLQGSQHRTNKNSQATFGFTVNWSFSGAPPSPPPLLRPQSSTALSPEPPARPVVFPDIPSPSCGDLRHP